MLKKDDFWDKFEVTLKAYSSKLTPSERITKGVFEQLEMLAFDCDRTCGQ